MAFRTSPFRRRLALAVVAGLGLTAVATGPVSARPAPDARARRRRRIPGARPAYPRRPQRRRPHRRGHRLRRTRRAVRLGDPVRGCGDHPARLPAGGGAPTPARRRGRRHLRLPAGRLELPRLRRADRRGQPGGRRPPGHRPQDQHRSVVRGPRPDGGEDLRQRRHRRGRAGDPVQLPAARPRAPDRRDGDLPAQPASPTATAATRGSPASSTPGRSGSSRPSTRTAASTTSPPAPTGPGARTGSPTAALRRSAPT